MLDGRIHDPPAAASDLQAGRPSVQRTHLVSLVALVLCALVGGVWWITHRAPPRQPAELARVQEPPQPAEIERASAELERAPANDGAVEFGSLETTVVFPLEVELEILRARFRPEAPGVPALGSGSNAAVKGRIVGPDTRGARAEITFVGGTNTGRVLHTDGNGAFGANDLQPGISVVTVTGPGLVGAQREMLLRPERETQFNVGFVRPSRVAGTVYDHEGKPLSEAAVTFDGQLAHTDETGVFELQAVAPGEVLVIVEKPGFAAYRELVTVQFGTKIEKEKLQFRLQRAARLQVNVPDRMNSTEQAWFYLLPEADGSQRRFPWHLVNPQRIWSGGSLTIEGLPTGTYSARLFQAGAEAAPKVAAVSLGAGETAIVDFHLAPAKVVQGIVRDRGRTEAGIVVRMEAPDRTQANLTVFQRESYLHLENDVFPNLPTAVQEVVSNGQGEFTFSAHEDVSAVRYVTATSKDQRRFAFVVVKPGDTHVELELVPIEDGQSELRLATNARHQALPLVVTVNGAPRDQVLVPPGRDVRIGGLQRGTWVANVRWNGEWILKSAAIDLDGEVTRDVVLPEGAIAGQDADTARRAGRR